MQPQVVRQLSSATPGKIIVVKEQEPRPIRSNSTHNAADKWSAAPAVGHSVSGRRKSSSSKQAHAKNTPKQAAKKKARSGTPKKQRIPEPPQLQPPTKQKKDTSLKDTLVTALLARMRTEGPIFGASVSRSITPSGAPTAMPQQSFFGTTSMEDELIRKLKRAVIDTLHEEGISRTEDSPKTLHSSQTRDFAVETDRVGNKATNKASKGTKKGGPVATTTVMLPNRPSNASVTASKKAPQDPIFDDLQDDELYDKQLHELMENTYIPGTTVDEYTVNQSSGDDVIDVTSLAEKGAHAPNLYERVNMNQVLNKAGRPIHERDRRMMQPIDEDYDGSESEQSIVTKELHNAVKMTTQLASMLPRGEKGSKNVSQMVTNLTTTINTILHAYKGDKDSPATTPPYASVVESRPKDSAIHLQVPQQAACLLACNEVSDTQDHVPSYKDAANVRRFLDDAIFEYPEIPESIVEKISRRVALQIDRDPHMTETAARQLFQDEINHFLLRAAAANGSNVDQALASSTIASSKVDRISSNTGFASRGLANEESAPSMTLPEQTELCYPPQDNGGYGTSYRSHIHPIKSRSTLAKTESAGTRSPGRSSSATDPTQMSLSDYTNIPVPKIEKIKPNSSYTSDTSVDYVIQRTNFDREVAHDATHQQQSPFAHQHGGYQDALNQQSYPNNDMYMVRGSSDFQNIQTRDKLSPPKTIPTITQPVYLPQHGKASPPPAKKYEFDDLEIGINNATQGIEITTGPSIPDEYRFDDLDPSQLINKKTVEIDPELNLGNVLQTEEPTDGYERYLMQRERISRKAFFEQSAGLPTVEVDQPDHDILVRKVMDDDSKDWDAQINEQLDFVDDGSDSGCIEDYEVKEQDVPTSVPVIIEPALPHEVISAGRRFGIDDSILDVSPPAPAPILSADQTALNDELLPVPDRPKADPEQIQNPEASPDIDPINTDDKILEPTVTNKEPEYPEAPLSAQVTDDLEPEPRQPILYEPDPNVTVQEVEQYIDIFCKFLSNPSDSTVSLEALIDVNDETTHLSALFDCCILALSNIGLYVVSQLSKAVITDCDALEAEYLDNKGFYKFTLHRTQEELNVFSITDRFQAMLAEGYANDEAQLKVYLFQQLKAATNVQPSYTAAVTAGVKQTEKIFFDEMDAIRLSNEIADTILSDLAGEVAALFPM